MNCAAILFDMDGTLVDSTAIVVRAWTAWAAKHRLPVGEILRFSHGRPAPSTMEHFLPGRDHASDIAEMGRFEETELTGIKAVPGAEEVLRTVVNGRWAIVTSAWRTLAVSRVQAAGLPVPNVLVPIDEIAQGKPHPEGFLRAATTLGVNPADCLVFEDTRPGIEAGLSAGMQVVALSTTHAAADLGHGTVIRDYRDISVKGRGAGFEVVL
jgi:sugar-phosphatase